jgi:hypothetical protein
MPSAEPSHCAGGIPHVRMYPRPGRPCGTASRPATRSPRQAMTRRHSTAYVDHLPAPERCGRLRKETP